MATNKLSSGSQLPEITLSLVAGGEVTLGKPQNEGNWKLVFIYRGLHCPLCKGYLQKLESLKDKFLAIGAEIIAISGDPEAKALSMAESTGLSYPGSTSGRCKTWDFISLIHDPQRKQTDLFLSQACSP